MSEDSKGPVTPPTEGAEDAEDRCRELAFALQPPPRNLFNRDDWP